MTTATTRQTIRRELYSRVAGLGAAFTASSVTATTVTIAALDDTTVAINQYRGYYLYRPEVAAADQVRKITTVSPSTGQVVHGGANYADTSNTVVELVGLLHPDEINNAITRALKRIYHEYAVPLSGRITDGDMDANNTTSWTDVGTPATKAKSTTAAKVFSGIRALRVLNDAAGEGVQSVSVRGFPAGSYAYAHAVVHADVGTAELHLYNVTGSASIASVTSAEEGFVHLYVKAQVPSGCEELALRLLGTENNADIYWNHAVLYLSEDRMFPAPSWLDEPWKFMKLREMRYRRALSSQANGGYDAAYSREPHDWRQPQAFMLEPYHQDTNPYTIQLMRPVPSNELWIVGKRPFFDTDTLSTDASTTLAPLELLYAYATDELADILMLRYPNEQRWKQLKSQAQLRIDAETSARPEVPLQPVKHEYWGYI